MRFFVLLSASLIAYFTYGFYISQFEMNVVPSQLRRENPPGLYDYRGIINIHSNLSLGSSSLSQIIASGRNLNLDFMIFTDLNVFTSDSQIFEGYHGNTLVLIANKYSYLDSRIIYYSNNPVPLAENLGEVQVKLSDLLSKTQDEKKDELLILAHPYKAGFSWVGEIPEGLDGFELINTKGLSRRAWEISIPSTIWSLITFPFNPPLAFARLFSEPSEELNLFDRLGSRRHVVGIAGAEASARALPLSNFLIKFPSYQRSFELFSNHLLLSSELTGNSIRDRQKIFAAIKQGQLYLSFDLIGDPKGFSYFIEDGSNIHLMGAETKLKRGMKLRVQLPVRPISYFEVVVYRDGIRFETFNDTEVEMPIKESGNYRVQVRVAPRLPLPDAKKWITWIYSNQIRITK